MSPSAARSHGAKAPAPPSSARPGLQEPAAGHGLQIVWWGPSTALVRQRDFPGVGANIRPFGPSLSGRKLFTVVRPLNGQIMKALRGVAFGLFVLWAQTGQAQVPSLRIQPAESAHQS